MFKFVVLCAFLTAAAAEPGALFAAPITHYSTIVAPGSTSISKYDTSVVHPSPLKYYSALPLAYTHFIKKRSPQLPLAYYSPASYLAATPYIAPNRYVATAPLISSAHILPGVAPITPAVHLIKKRSASLLPTYFAPHVYTSASAPILTTSYASANPLIHSTPIISHPFTYTHFIKKRSAPLLNTYIAPAAYSHQSRFDLQTSHTPLTTISYNTPLTYPLTYSHIY